MNLVTLTESQARFLVSLSKAAADYRGSWESIMKRGADEIDRLNNSQWITGPSHQIMSEVQQEYGQIKVMLELLWSVFTLSDLPEGADPKEAVKEVEQLLAIALGEPKKNASIGGGTWFREGQKLSDF